MILEVTYIFASLHILHVDYLDTRATWYLKNGREKKINKINKNNINTYIHIYTHLYIYPYIHTYTQTYTRVHT